MNGSTPHIRGSSILKGHEIGHIVCSIATYSHADMIRHYVESACTFLLEFSLHKPVIKPRCLSSIFFRSSSNLVKPSSPFTCVLQRPNINVLTSTPTVPITKVDPARHDRLGAGRASSSALYSGPFFRESELTVREGSDEVIVNAYCVENAKRAFRFPGCCQTTSKKDGSAMTHI